MVKKNSLEIAFDSHRHAAWTGPSFGITKKWVHVIRNVVADAFMVTQLALLDKLVLTRSSVVLIKCWAKA